MKFLPEAASSFAPAVDNAFFWVTLICVVFFVLVTFLIVVFPLVYRRKTAQDKTPDIHGNIFLEVLWTVIPTLLTLGIFAYGLVVYNKVRAIPDEGMQVQVNAQMWLWQFTYEDGRTLVNELYVPKDEPVTLIMRSKDVIHSLFIPAFRTKQDVIPNAYTKLWFEATQAGTFDIFCTEYCGTNHSGMLAKVHVLERPDYEAWVQAAQATTDSTQTGDPVALGAKLYTERGCNACHSVEGVRLVGPAFNNLFGKTETLEGGATVVIDENYLRESLIQPQAKVAQGYPPVMPSFQGLLNDQEIDAIIAYIKSLK